MGIISFISQSKIIANDCWTPGGSRKAPIKEFLSVLPSVHSSRCFLGIGSLVFAKFWLGGRIPYEVVHDRTGLKIKEYPKEEQKIRFFKFIEKFYH